MLIRSVAAYGIAAIVPQFCSYLLLPILARVLSREEFGAMSLIDAATSVVAPIVSLCLERGAQRYYFEAKPGAEDEIFANALRFMLAIGLTILAITAGFVLAGVRISGTPQFTLPTVVIVSSCMSIGGLALVYCQVQGRATTYLAIQSMKGVALLLAGYLAVAYFRLGVQGFLISLIVSYVLVAAVAFSFLPSPFPLQVDRQLIRKMLSFSIPFVPTVLGAWILAMCGRFFLNAYATLGDVGLYSFWYKISLAYFLCSTAINTAIGPYAYRALTADASGAHLMQSQLPSLIRIYGLMAVAFMLVSPEAGGLIGGLGYQMSPLLFGLIICGHYLSSVMGCSSDLLLSFFKLTKIQMIVFLFSAALNLVLNFAITREFGIYGVVISSATSITAIAWAHWFVLRKKGLPRFRVADIAIWFAAILIVGVMMAIADSLQSPSGRVLRAAGVLAAVLLAVRTFREFRGTMKRKDVDDVVNER